MLSPWDDKDPEKEPQTFRLHIKDEETERLLSNELWGWRMIPGVSVSIHGQRYTVKRITTHPKNEKISIVWVRKYQRSKK